MQSACSCANGYCTDIRNVKGAFSIYLNFFDYLSYQDNTSIIQFFKLEPLVSVQLIFLCILLCVTFLYI
jgi:hypothetical protein